MLVDSEEVLAMFCGECLYRGEPIGSDICEICDVKRRIELCREQHQQSHCTYHSGYT